MKISGTLRGDITKVVFKYDETSGTKTAIVTVAVGCDAPMMKKLFGAELTKVAFDDDGSARGYVKLMPDFICELHDINLAGHKIKCQPVVKQLAPIEDTDCVLVTVELPLTLQNKTLAGALVDTLGTVASIECTPLQEELPLSLREEATTELRVLSKAVGSTPKSSVTVTRTA